MSTPRSRIPEALQAIFLTSNRGGEVDEVPPDKVANRSFRTWFSQRGGKGTEEILPSTEELTKVSEEALASPQVFLDSLLESRGYNTTAHQTIKSAYYNRPTRLQLASYDRHLIDVAKSGNTEKLKTMIGAGLSPNPSNSFGESLLHMVCRRGWADVLAYLVNELRVDLQIADDHGRHPLHDCCWAAEPNFQIAKVLLECDPHLFYMADLRGSLPLSYVPKIHWAAWVAFLDAVKDTFWPLEANGKTDPPPLVLQAPDSRPMPDPENDCSPELAKMVASGRMKPYEVILLQLEEQNGCCDDVDETTDDDSDFDDESCSSYSSRDSYLDDIE